MADIVERLNTLFSDSASMREPEGKLIRDVIDEALAAIKDARSAALEEAAKVAHRISASARSFGGEETAEMIEREIRALRVRTGTFT